LQTLLATVAVKEEFPYFIPIYSLCRWVFKQPQ